MVLADGESALDEDEMLEICTAINISYFYIKSNIVVHISFCLYLLLTCISAGVSEENSTMSQSVLRSTRIVEVRDLNINSNISHQILLRSNELRCSKLIL